MIRKSLLQITQLVTLLLNKRLRKHKLLQSISSINSQNTKTELEAKNAELEKVSADLESEIQELSSKIVARQDSLAKQARSAQQNNTATSYINSILNSKSISEAITRITAISKVVTANNDLLTKQESDQKSLLLNKKKIKLQLILLQLISQNLKQQKLV